MNKLLKYGLGGFLFLSLSMSTPFISARGCNKPYKVCTNNSSSHLWGAIKNSVNCTWYDKTGCKSCSKTECTKNRGCKWGGLIKKSCQADYSSGKDSTSQLATQYFH